MWRLTRAPVLDEVTVDWTTKQPRAGRPLEGRLRLRGSQKPEQRYRVALTCERRYGPNVDERRARVESFFEAEQDVGVVQSAVGWSVPFRFDIPVTAPASDHSDANPEGYLWNLEYYRADAWISLRKGIAVVIGPAPAEEIAALEAAETPAQKAAILAFARTAGRDTLLPHERAELRAMSPAELTTARKEVETSVRKLTGAFLWFVALIVGLPLLVCILLFIGVVLR